jgi:hypothetical protein
MSSRHFCTNTFLQTLVKKRRFGRVVLRIQQLGFEDRAGDELAFLGDWSGGFERIGPVGGTHRRDGCSFDEPHIFVLCKRGNGLTFQ